MIFKTLGLFGVVVPLAIFNTTSRAAELPYEVVLNGLNNPCGVAVQPGTGHLFISVSGDGKIVRVVNGQVEDVIVGFPRDSYGKGPAYDIGPLGIAFLNQQFLVVGGGGLVDGEELVRIYEIPEPGEPAIDAASMSQSLGPLKAEGERPGEGDYYGVATNKTTIYLSSNGDDQKGWIVKSTFKVPNGIEPLERFIATKEQVSVDAPTGITISPNGHLVVGQMGEIDRPNDSLLTFYNAANGQLLLSLATGLHDIVAVAYGSVREPSKKSHLYALDFAWNDPAEGGLFRLDASLDEQGRQKIKSNRLAALEKPTAMALGLDKSLFVTILGAGKASGKLLKFKPGL